MKTPKKSNQEKIVVYKIEDLDAVIKKYGEEKVLSLLDDGGFNKTDIPYKKIIL